MKKSNKIKLEDLENSAGTEWNYAAPVRTRGKEVLAHEADIGDCHE